jgi:hypothetical protein
MRSREIFDKETFTETRRNEIMESMSEAERVIACNPLRAIREKCLSCCSGRVDAVAHCDKYKCPLWDFRFGTNPYKEERVYSDTEKAAALDLINN